MQANEAIRAAIGGRHGKEAESTCEVFAEWRRDPSWSLLRRVSALRVQLANRFLCSVDLIAFGPGCFYARYGLELPSPEQSLLVSEDGKEVLRELKHAFDVDRLRVTLESSPGKSKKITIN